MATIKSFLVDVSKAKTKSSCYTPSSTQHHNFVRNLPPLLIYLIVRFVLFFSIFKLYELGTEPERKEFLDDLFTFMQKRGKIV